MIRLNYVIKNLAPIAFCEKSSDSVLYATSKFIPGSSVRGALASNYIMTNDLKDAHRDEGFYELFLSGAVKFLPAYPIGSLDRYESNPFVLPLSLTRSKDGSKISDLADGNKAQAGYKKISGYAVADNDNIYTANAKIFTEFHMSRKDDSERITGSSNKGNVFNYEYLAPGQIFKGSIIVEDDLLAKVKTLLSDNPIVHLGRSKNVQYGKCELEAFLSTTNSLKFNSQKKLYLLALTPYIPFDDFQDIAKLLDDLEQEVVSAAKEKNITLLPILNKENRNIFADTEDINGFVGVWHLKRARQEAVKAGSLFEINTQGLDSKSVSALEEVLYRGFGDRTEDGYGQFRLWQPMGLVKDPGKFDLNSAVFLSFDTDFLFKYNFKQAKDLPKTYAKLLNKKAPKSLAFTEKDFKVITDGKPLDFNFKKVRAKKIQAGTELLLTTEGLTQEKLLCLASLLEECKGEQPDDGNEYGKIHMYQTKSLRSNPSAEVPADFTGSITDKAVEVLRSRILLELRKAAAEYVQKMSSGKRTGKTGNHILRRLLVLMESNLTRKDILVEINKSFKKTASDNITKIRFIDNTNLLEKLNSNEQPYTKFSLTDKIGLTEQDVENLKADLGADAFDIPDDILFKEFWLWFIRHEVKVNDNTCIQEQGKEM